MNLFRAVFPSCRQVSQMQSEALDRSLPIVPRFKMRMHLLVCSWCRRYGKQIRFLRKAAHDHSEELETVGDQTLSTDAKERIKRSLQDHSR